MEKFFVERIHKNHKINIQTRQPCCKQKKSDKGAEKLFHYASY